MTREYIVVRQAVEEDVNFIFATALRNTWYSKELQTTFDKAKYMQVKHMEIERQLNDYPTFIACLDQEPMVILGYIIGSPKPYSYIKKAWRTVPTIEQMLHDALNRFNGTKETAQ